MGPSRGFANDTGNVTLSGTPAAITNLLRMMGGGVVTGSQPYQFGGNSPATMHTPYQFGGKSAGPRDFKAAKGTKGGPNNRSSGNGNGRGQRSHQATENAEQESAVMAPVRPGKNLPLFLAKCANCKRVGHWLLRCVGPPNSAGFIPGCPHCNDLGHNWEQCSEFDPNDIEKICKYLLEMRHNIPQFQFTKPLHQLELAQPGKKYHGMRPWSTYFALKFWSENPDYWKNHVYNKDMNDDVLLAVDPWDPALIVKVPNNILFAGPPVQATRPGQKKRKARTEESGPAKKGKTDGDRMEMDPIPESTPQTGGAATAAQSGLGVPVGDIIKGGPNVNVIKNNRGITFAITGPGNPAKPQDQSSFGARGGLAPCTNCGQDHRPSDCESPCGGCGEQGHQHPGCPKISVVCVCRQHPQHIPDKCTLLCTQACHPNHLFQAHMAVACPRCCKCGGLHNAVSCEKPWSCARCHTGNKKTEGSHTSMEHKIFFPEDNIELGCKNVKCDKYYCTVHCQMCALMHTGQCNSVGFTEGGHSWVTCQHKHDKVLFGNDCPGCVGNA